VRSSQSGQFKASSLPPGRYLVTAVDVFEDGAEREADALERLRRSATSLTLGEGESKTVNVKLRPD
jgi:hypothetical protein